MQEMETPRLVLRPMTELDAPALFAILGDAEVCRWQPFAPFETEAQARECIREMSEELAESEKTAEEFRFGIYSKEEKTIIGQLGVERDAARGGYELGVTLGRRFWGKGFASEAVSALLRFMRKNYGAEAFFARIADENAASVALARRIGFAPEGRADFTKPGAGQPIKATLYTLNFTK